MASCSVFGAVMTELSNSSCQKSEEVARLLAQAAELARESRRNFWTAVLPEHLAGVAARCRDRRDRQQGLPAQECETSAAESLSVAQAEVGSVQRVVNRSMA